MTARTAEADDGPPPEGDIIQRVTEGLIYCIRSGQMAPGQHLVEGDLTRRFGVSRGSLREGLKQLSSIGIVKLTRFRGAFIAALDRKSVHDLLDVLEPLCGLAAKLAAQECRNDRDKAELKRIAAELGAIADGGARANYLENRRLFYDRLIEIGGNSELGKVIPLARTDLFRAQFETAQTKDQRKRHANGYAKIAEAVAENDPAKAERAVRKHFAATRKTVEALPGYAFAASA
ncbi:GntR family transcriptional regulator [Sphingomonas sp. SUN019]|uniref:GntR family transcriptional regulator n=1 Tax=Sphingomonas sp. SUN019 TaxID=2937788 RepID=UPI0021649991|nr:GntR family transcriptional regulator [Sphingomonas sp. SUN019]UVO52004.1 GntR family transcriptional regulator [Sphingomonas sp. SUN019]